MRNYKKICMYVILLLSIFTCNVFAYDEVSYYAGSGEPSYKDGILSEALFNQPYGMAIDSNGDIFVADTYNNRIRKISNNEVTTIAGTSEVNDIMGFPLGGLKDGKTKEAYFNRPRDLAINSAGDIFVADTDNNVIRKISDGNVTTFSGKSTAGYKDGKSNIALFNAPSGITVNSDDQIYIADTMNNKIRIIDERGQVSTMKFVSADSSYDYSVLNEPSDIMFDSYNNLYVVDSGNQMVKKVVDGKIYPVAGSIGEKNSFGYIGSGFVNGNSNSAMFNFPKGICILDNGLIFIADTWNHSIRVIKPDNTVENLAGSIKADNRVGTLEESSFNAPSALAYHDGFLYVSDMWNNCIKRIKLEYGNKIFDLDLDFVSKDIDFSKRDQAFVNIAIGNDFIDFKDITTINIDGSTYFPIRTIAEKLGASVDYDGNNRSVNIIYKGKEINYNLDSEDLKVINNRSLIHIRTLANDLGFFVSWNGKYNTVIVTQ
ncbi:stalk domain-containing protein [Anaerovorax odorimutans]|uniref:stalk domain-containing protein n=1 Tax=Anaerovorax odorimutans TaxID=109327 RepID=UPI0004011F71|nr:stalk domain-containing protein [Anaerovorax odorimutans]